MSTSKEALQGSFSLSTQKRLSARPPHLLVRFSESTLQTALAGTIPVAISFSADGLPRLVVGSEVHQVSAVNEEQPHEVYECRAGSSSLKSIAYVGQRLTVKQELDQDVQNRVRNRTEAANAERQDRHIVVLDHDPTKKGKKGMRQEIHARPPSRSSSPASHSASTTPKIRQPSRLVITDKRQTRPPVQQPQASDSHFATGPASEQQPIQAGSDDVKRSNSDSSNESSNEAALFSHPSSLSSRTSVSSADSPPSKDPAFAPHPETHTALLPTIAASHVQASSSSSAATPKLGFTQSPMLSTSLSSLSIKKSSSTTSLKRKAAGSDDLSDSSKKQRVDSDPSRPKKPQANGRSAGGTRYHRPAKHGSANMDRTPSASTSASSEVEVVIRKSKPERSPDVKSSRKRRATPEFTSSEDERDASGEMDAEGEIDDVPMASLSRSARSEQTKPLRTAISSLIAAERTVPATPQQSTSPATSRANTPGGQEAVKTWTITTDKEYKQHRGRFMLMHQAYERQRQSIIRQRMLMQSLIDGTDLSEAERRIVPSQNEAKETIAKAQRAKAELEQLKACIWAYAKSRVQPA